MSIHVSEPGRPVGTRLPEIFRGRRVDELEQTREMARGDARHSEATDAEFVHAQRVQARRAFAEYGEVQATDPEGRRAYLPVSQICRRTLVTIDASATLDQGLVLMDESGLHHLVVLVDNLVAGLVDLRWILAWLHENAADGTRETFAGLELPAFLTATPETDAHQLARLMLAHQLSAALVLDQDGTSVGLVTSTDYLRLYADASRQEGNV